MTPRQVDAFGVYRAALRVWLIVKAKPCATNEESKERWRQLQNLEKDLELAREEIDASIIDETPEEVGHIEIVEAPGDRCRGLGSVVTAEGIAECPGCRACS